MSRQANLVLLNTCSIREKADQKFYSELGRLKRLKQHRPDMLIGVCGCIPQRARGEILARAPYVDLVFGTLNVSRVLELLQQVEEDTVNPSWKLPTGCWTMTWAPSL